MTAENSIDRAETPEKRFPFFSKMIVASIIIGLAARFVIGGLFTYGYDVSHWAIVMANIASGNGLYGLTGYFYTPVWGYFLSFGELIGQTFLSIGDWGTRITAALVFEEYSDWYISSNTTSIAFGLAVKTPLFIVDLIDGWLIYRLVLELTGNNRKARLGFVLWFLCPLVIAVSAVSAMFDCLVVMMVLLAVLLAMHDRYFGAGILLALAAYTKLFPAFLVPLLIAYVLVKHREDRRTAYRSIGLAALGAAVTTLVIFFPQILDGTLMNCFSFITARAGSEDSLLKQLIGADTVLAYLGITAGSLIIACAYLFYAGKHPERELMTALLLNSTVIFFYPPTPQYLLLLLPFLTVYIVTRDRSFLKSWAVIVTGATLFAFANNASLLLTLSEYSNLLSTDTVVTLTSWFQGHVFGLAKMAYLYYGGGIIQYIGIIYLAWCEYGGRIMRLQFWKYPRNATFSDLEEDQ